jgi:hypothetical protein
MSVGVAPGDGAARPCDSALVVPIGHSGKTGAPELSQFGNML